ncbi:MAG TPA: LysR substrate-binding domain-containing protein [Bacteroidia bacterium]|mgnify:CR=1 FL=1|nr:LysR family transcriptional regulator [Bacteroidia bacterium]MBP9922824.1 LysR family transcriptional regulator [Bacteroidia bacterium]HQW21758.1 LysR substrate-binding domain-containing protein [Bacteroidia bacterium]
MNLVQLEYIVAVDSARHFAKAAEKCFVTQPTLSMMIQKLEEELGVKIFDRSRQPVVPTKEGEQLIIHAKTVLADLDRMKGYAKELQGEIAGEFHIAIIPTLAPYLIPLFIKQFTAKFPLLSVHMKEMTTEEIIPKLKRREIDAALLATPLMENGLTEHKLFNEEFYVYASKSELLPKKKYVLPGDLNINHLWLLEEGHCMRNQVFNLCELKKMDTSKTNLLYEAGSIETLIQLVDKLEGITIVPRLSTLTMTTKQKSKLHEFANPKPVREISLVTVDSYPRKKLVQQLSDLITSNLPFEVSSKKTDVVAVFN